MTRVRPKMGCAVLLVLVGGALAPSSLATEGMVRGPNCLRRCHAQARDVYEACRAEGGSLERCAIRAREALEACLGACDDALGCRERCALRAKDFFRECVADGGTLAECGEKAREVLDACLVSECNRPPDCEEQCQVLARRALRACLQTGEEEQACRNRAQEVLRRCLSECGEVCGGIAGVVCAEGEYCRFPAGTCDVADRQGICRPIPDACPTVWDPVCGCDGVTYANGCEANLTGGGVAHEGECREACDPNEAGTCGERRFCRLRHGMCEAADAQGVCITVPEVCPELFAPVCGCDGVTYANECEAILVGAQVRHLGECRQACGGPDAAPCDVNEFCKLPRGTCEDPNAIGYCREVPLDCPRIVDPVCGCDGMTYANECLADLAGVGVDRRGPCLLGCDPAAPETCGERQFCAVAPGECDSAAGVCLPRPTLCFGLVDPVCGCDGVTYRNVCEAAASGVSVDHRGSCDG